MKKLLVLCVSLFAFGAAAHAGNDRQIQVNQLPQKAQSFIQKNFASEKVIFAKAEKEHFGTKYEVSLSNEMKIEFNNDGEWKEIESRVATIPEKLIPAQIASYVKNTYPNVGFKKIDRDSKGYEVKLFNGVELDFDKNFKLIDSDMD